MHVISESNPSDYSNIYLKKKVNSKLTQNNMS